jgi:hypothetical protein
MSGLPHSVDPFKDAEFIEQCEADYICAEITTIAHVSSKTAPPTHLLAVVELLHRHLEANPLIGLSPPIGYPRRTSLGPRGGTLLIQKWTLSVRKGIEWYLACQKGSMLVPGLKKDTSVQLSRLGADPPWPHLVVEVQNFWKYAEFWGNRPGGSRWHRLLPLEPVEVQNNWGQEEARKARAFLLDEIHVDLFSRSVLLGSCHLRLPNPVYRKIKQRIGEDGKSITYEVIPYPDQPISMLELTFWNRRAWGATEIRRIELQSGVNQLAVPEGVEQVAHAIHSKGRGLMEQSEPGWFLTSLNLQMNLITEQRRVEMPFDSLEASDAYTVGVVGHTQEIEIGTPRPSGAISRLANDEDQQSIQKAWSEISFRWFDGDSAGGIQAVRDIIGTATKRIDLLDPYFGHRDLMKFALATTRQGLPLRVLTSADFCRHANHSGTQTDPEIEQGGKLLRALVLVRAQDPRLDIEIKVMAGQKSPIHDRFLIVDDNVWVLGASLNEFGARGTLLMRLPKPPAKQVDGASPFSVSQDVFNEYWHRSEEVTTPLNEWVRRRAVESIGTTVTNHPKSKLINRLRAIKAAFSEFLLQIKEAWHA